jgi:branched-chain amino acid transport system permease protein
MVIGGVGSMAGLLLGSIIVAALEHTTEWWLSAEWERLTVFGLLLFFLICRPNGIYGWPGRATRS